MTEAVASTGLARNDLLKVAGLGLLTGILTPLFPALIDKIVSMPSDLRIALVALPFAALVFVVVRRYSANPPWAALAAVAITLIAFVCAVNAAIWIDGQFGGVARVPANMLAGLTGGFVGAGVMALGVGLLPAGPRAMAAWLPMLVTGTCAGALLALDGVLELDLTSFLYPVWQAGVAIRLAMALGQRGATER